MLAPQPDNLISIVNHQPTFLNENEKTSPGLGSRKYSSARRSQSELQGLNNVLVTNAGQTMRPNPLALDL